ncbi:MULTISPECIES: DUF3429 domain-containing protein [Spongiibacter]|uniref:DUF3429 domain-containing protein n=1 Tax=Spongiibacter TaxID=630749 RepID=UPI0003B4AEA4|nr:MULTISPECIES: DUF3429 domain-containing protein [Spongiibacter]MAY38876.1 DUF3429 domain-containing protein [Spongiibacter sp.]MBI57008.1 DUF3429 domain-containing protein [Spongiibacter sp.]|tara:strand:- start:174 stop:602 length:429 start_codon:yes stop_codon:yes gene_type:complete
MRKAESSLAYIVAGALGALPFLAAAWLTLLGGSWMGLSGQALLHSYGIAITGFMAGTLWGGTFSPPRFQDALLGMLAALALTLVVWMPMPQAYLTLVVLLATLWAYDLLRFYRYGLPRWYTGLRCSLSTVAIAALLAGFFWA